MRVVVAVLIAINGMVVPLSADSYGRVGQHFSLAGKRKEFKAEGWTCAVVASAENSEGLMSLVEETWTPKYSIKPQFHKFHAESYYVISGKVEWTVGGETRVLGKDDCVHIPPQTPYSAKISGDQNAKLLRLYQPGGFEVTQELLQSLTPADLNDKQFAPILAKATDVYEYKAGLSETQTKTATKYFNMQVDRKYIDDDGKSGPAISTVDGAGRTNLQEEHWSSNFMVGTHHHKTKAETFYVLDNTIEWTVGGEKHLLKAGDAVHIPANVPHSAKATDGKSLHTLMFYHTHGYDLGLEIGQEIPADKKNDGKYQKVVKAITDFHSGK